MRRTALRTDALIAAGAVVIAAVAVLLLTRGGGEPAQSPPAIPANGFFGVNDSSLYADAQAGREAESSEQTAAMAKAGVQWVRFSTAWRGEEPTLPFQGQHQYDFQFLDKAVTALAQQQLPMELTLTTTPVWAADGTDPEGCSANIRPKAESFADYAAYAVAVDQRYGKGGKFWSENPDLPVSPLRGLEIWNEPNLNASWCPEPNPELYAQMFADAATALHKADPGVRVIAGGLSSVFDNDGSAAAVGGMDANEFVKRVVAAEPKFGELADAIGFHPYDADVAGILGRVSKFRAGLDDAGLSKLPIEVNETGWPTEGPAYAVPDPQRAGLVTDLTDRLWTSPCDVDGLAIYAWRTAETPPGASDAFYGLADPATAALNPSGSAYSEAIRDLSGLRPKPEGSCG